MAQSAHAMQRIGPIALYLVVLHEWVALQWNAGRSTLSWQSTWPRECATDGQIKRSKVQLQYQQKRFV